MSKRSNTSDECKSRHVLVVLILVIGSFSQIWERLPDAFDHVARSWVFVWLVHVLLTSWLREHAVREGRIWVVMIHDIERIPDILLSSACLTGRWLIS